MSVGLLYDPRFVGHRSPPGHPECPERLDACVRALGEAGLWDRVARHDGRPMRRDEVARVHRAEYLDALPAIAGRDGYLDPDTFHSAGSWEAVQWAAGGTTELALAVADGKHRAATALVRPPGHHATRRGPGGFCIIDNIAVAAAALRERGMRVAIVDFDVHHGNGTQDIFYEDPAVLFVSLHRYGHGFYPGTGARDETGTGPGQGTTINLPMAAGTGNDSYRTAFDEVIGPALERFAPDMLLVSAGFDAHARDPLGGLCLDDAGYVALIERLAGWANRLCDGRWMAVLEGGYDLTALGCGVTALVARMLAG